MGDSLIRSTEQTWNGFAKNLINIFGTQFGRQSDIYSTLTKTLTDQLTNPHGFSPTTLSALRGGLTDNVANQFDSARQGVQATEAARGDFGSDVKSGVDAQISGQIAGQQAGAEASGLDTIEQQDAQLKNENQWKAVQGLDSIAQGENPVPFASQATGAAGETGSLGTAYFGTNNSGFGDKLGSSFATGLGNVLSGNAVLGGPGANKALGG